MFVCVMLSEITLTFRHVTSQVFSAQCERIGLSSPVYYYFLNLKTFQILN